MRQAAGRGIQMAPTSPITSFTPSVTAPPQDHRIDGRIGYSRMNRQEHWMGAEAAGWRDTQSAREGEAVTVLQTVFMIDCGYRDYVPS